MIHSLFTHTIDTAFDDAVGEHGADKARHAYWLDKLTPAIARILGTPQREAAPLFALPSRTDDLQEIEEVAAHIAHHFTTLVVAGMGGSSLGGETLANIRERHNIAMHFLDNIDPFSMDALTAQLPWKETAFLFISKSGGTVETLAQMALLMRLLKKEVGAAFGKQCWVITVPNGNAMHTLAKEHAMQVLAHDPDLGGRFSALSLVGLIPAAVAGLDVRKIRSGAQMVMDNYHEIARSAALQMALMEKNIRISAIMHYGDRLRDLAAWYRQCWAESLGKCEQVMTPVRSRCATDQHSQLQLYLDGPKDKLFTVIMLECKGKGGLIDYEVGGDTRLDFLRGKTMGDLMAAQQRATVDTLIKRGSPVRTLVIPELNEAAVGALLMYFALEVIFVAELLGVNAFDQPAVEEGKVLALNYLAASDA